jgi:hypothetical protein
MKVVWLWSLNIPGIVLFISAQQIITDEERLASIYRMRDAPLGADRSEEPAINGL